MAKDESAFTGFAELLMQNGPDAVIAAFDQIKDWPREALSELLVFLAAYGGAKWPTRLCDMGADCNFVDQEGQTALSQCVHGHESVSGSHDTFETAIELLAAGADPNSSYLSLFSVTHLAVARNQPELAALFLMAGADLDRPEPDVQSRIPLRQALLNSPTVYPNLEGQSWPSMLVSILGVDD